ncbi:MAG TPA: hypothetical protein VGM42_10420 [Rhodopila sp.]
MLSPATFIGIANATAPIGQPAPGRSPNIQPARVLTTPPVAAPIAQPQTRTAPTASSAAPSSTQPPRNLPRGSLLDLSV